MQQNAPFSVLLKIIPFFHGFIILYLKFWLHRFYIQNAAECTILRPTALPFSLSRVGMYIFFQKDQTRVCNITCTWLNSLFVSKNNVMWTITSITELDYQSFTHIM
jgi:hypothetical protein